MSESSEGLGEVGSERLGSCEVEAMLVFLKRGRGWTGQFGERKEGRTRRDEPRGWFGS